jgi:hypothetical protein
MNSTFKYICTKMYLFGVKTRILCIVRTTKKLYTQFYKQGYYLILSF